MSLSRLDVRNVRNLSDVNLLLDNKLNLFVGENGSGKSSLLESVYFLATGRSFRSIQLQPIVQHDQDSCTVYGVLERDDRQQVTLGVHRSLKGVQEVKVNGSKVNQMSILSRELPLLVLGPETVDLVQGPPTERRRYLNHGVFHVEHHFGEIWREVTRSLKQRNQILRDRNTDRVVLASWTSLLIEASLKIDQARTSYVKRLAPLFSEICHSLSGPKDVKCEYFPGWDKKTGLQETLYAQQESDLLRGFTQSGIHRADLRLTTGNRPASQVCSRGEMKLLAWSLVVSQGILLSRTEASCPIFLVDDLVSELDRSRQQKVAELLTREGGQVLVTGTDETRLKALWHGDTQKVFHVKQGVISEREI